MVNENLLKDSRSWTGLGLSNLTARDLSDFLKIGLSGSAHAPTRIEFGL
ncbi:conserved hypothetical protein [delta proteobacterium NaphS2]|nr:conserved hypothetical protein [delta proteobacterium NaphS2]